jgi:hypothetical protein
MNEAYVIREYRGLAKKQKMQVKRVGSCSKDLYVCNITGKLLLKIQDSSTLYWIFVNNLRFDIGRTTRNETAIFVKHDGTDLTGFKTVQHYIMQPSTMDGYLEKINKSTTTTQCHLYLII